MASNLLETSPRGRVSMNALPPIPCNNELIYESDCHDAFKLWLKAMNVDNALTQARNALRVISASDWLRSSDTVDDLCKMVDFQTRAVPIFDTTCPVLVGFLLLPLPNTPG